MLGYKHLPAILEGKVSKKDFAKVEEYASKFNNAKTILTTI